MTRADLIQGKPIPFRTAALLSIIFALIAPVSSRPAPAENELTKLADGVFVNVVNPDSNAVSNAGVVVLSHSVLVFDTHFTAEAGQALLGKIQALTPKPVRFLVNSHFHPDHTHGNQVFARAQFILSSNNTRRDVLQKDAPAFSRSVAAVQTQIDRMKKDAAAQQNASARESLLRQADARREALDRALRLKILPPTVTFDDSLVIQDGLREVRLLNLGIGHTDGDIVLYLPAEKIVFAGDLFFSAAFPNAQDAALLEWMKTLRELTKLNADNFVPGHGAPGTRKDVQDFLGYLEDLKSMVEPSVTRGDSVDQLIRDTPIPSKYSAFRFANFFPANLQKMYSELKALQLATASEQPDDGAKKTPEKPIP